MNIINKCIGRNHSNRYDSIDEIISDTLNLFNNDKEVTNKNLLNASIKVNSAIKMLEDYSYIKATDYKKDFFKVTKKGYDYFERYIYV